MSRRDDQRLDDVLASAAAIESHLRRGDLSDGLVFDAVRVRRIEIGEAVKDISAELLATEPGVPWRAVVGMRDRLAHRYFDTAYEVVKSTVDEDPAPRGCGGTDAVPVRSLSGERGRLCDASNIGPSPSYPLEHTLATRVDWQRRLVARVRPSRFESRKFMSTTSEPAPFVSLADSPLDSNYPGSSPASRYTRCAAATASNDLVGRGGKVRSDQVRQVGDAGRREHAQVGWIAVLVVGSKHGRSHPRPGRRRTAGRQDSHDRGATLRSTHHRPPTTNLRSKGSSEP